MLARGGQPPALDLSPATRCDGERATVNGLVARQVLNSTAMRAWSAGEAKEAFGNITAATPLRCLSFILEL